jgi:glutathione-regulated potassium-efflux system ancillary protein KefC
MNIASMDYLFVAIDYREPLWLAIALAMGFAARMISLPPLVGFLLAGFVLGAMGAEGGEFLQHVSDLGITLLLFSIGLKLNVRSLLRPEIWAVSSIHMLLIVILLAGVFLLIGKLGLPMIQDLNLQSAVLVAFALSFSSTVFAVKTLEDRGAANSRYGRIAVGVLIMQDVAAVVFMAVSAGKIPSLLALSLFLLVPLRRPMLSLLQRAGHGEVLILLGFVFALGGASLFEMVGLKGDLGALVLGVILSGHARSSELARSLLGFKELFLIGFFLSIGLTGIPTLQNLGIALLLSLFVPLKSALFFRLFARFRLTARTASYSSLTLANYSEFGLIVGALAVGSGWISPDWLVTLALALSLSFILAAPLNANAGRLYNRFRPKLYEYQSPDRLPEDAAVKIGDACMMVFGMGRVGTVVYDQMQQNMQGKVIGVDFNIATVDLQQQAGRNAVLGDATNPDFWSGMCGTQTQLQYVLFTMPNHQQQIRAATLLRQQGYTGKIAATAKYADETDELQKHGVDAAFNMYVEAGAGFASHVQAEFKIPGGA